MVTFFTANQREQLTNIKFRLPFFESFKSSFSAISLLSFNVYIHLYKVLSINHLIFLSKLLTNIINQLWLLCLSADDLQMDPRTTDVYTVIANRETYQDPQESQKGYPVLLDPLTSSRFVVLARSWSCQPTIYGRSVFNLWKPTLPEYWGRIKKEGKSGGGRGWSQYFFLCVWENISVYLNTPLNAD